MIDSDKVNFEKMIRATATLYPNIKNEDINTMMLKLFFASLREYSFEQVSYGFEKHLSDPVDGKFFPKPANIIKHLTEGKLTAEEQAEISWAEIERKIRSVGSYGTLKLEDGVALAALKGFTSWKDLCAMDVNKMTWAKKEFISLYQTYDKAPLESLPKALPGRVELEKQKKESAGYLADLKAGMDQFKNKLENKDM